MSTEQNKAVVRRLIDEVFNQGNISVVDDLATPGFIEHEDLPPGMPAGREGVKMLTSAMHGAFPDFHAAIEDLIAEGDKVVLRMTWKGTQKGEFLGIPASGKHLDITVIDILGFRDGKIVDHWGLMDNARMMQQLGAMPMPG